MDAFIVTIHALAAIGATGCWAYIGWSWYVGKAYRS